MMSFFDDQAPLETLPAHALDHACEHGYAPDSFQKLTEVIFFAASWDGARTTAMAPSVRRAKEFALAGAKCGLQTYEMAAEMNDEWPELRVENIYLEGGGTRLVIEAA